MLQLVSWLRIIGSGSTQCQIVMQELALKVLLQV
jgi:hypothetical protein